MNNKQTLVILSPGFPKNENDTTCLPSQQLFVKLLKQNFPYLNIIVLAFQYPFVDSCYSWYGVSVNSFNGWRISKISKPFYWLRIWKTLSKINKLNNLIGMFSFWCGECAWMGNRFRKKYGIKHFIWILGQDAKNENKYVKRVKPESHDLVAMSDFLAEEFYRNHAIKPEWIVPNGIDPSAFEKKTVERTIDIIGAGSLIHLKQFDLFIRIVKELKHHSPGINAVICGKGPEENKLITLIEKFELQDNISLIGEIPHAELLNLMQKAKILLHPSSYEGFSTVCLEAVSAGAHVISFCKPMNVDIKNWHIVKTQSQMKEITEEILREPALNHDPVFPFLMEESVKKVMKLFEG